jgi:hypothetical protein
MNGMCFSSQHQPDPQAVIAGTLCLLSCSLQSGTRLYLPKIVDNFNFLADCESLDHPLRTLCRRMASHWEAEQMSPRFAAEVGNDDPIVPGQPDTATDKPGGTQSPLLSYADARLIAFNFLERLTASTSAPQTTPGETRLSSPDAAKDKE